MIRVILGLAGFLVGMCIIGMVSHSVAHPQTMDRLVGEWPNCSYEQYIIGSAKQQGLQSVYQEGVLVREYYCKDGQLVWDKYYWPNGQLQEHSFETWDFQLITDQYDVNGQLIFHGHKK